MTTWQGNRSLEVLTLEIEGEIFAVEAVHVREILDLVPITEVPRSDPFVNGLINVRGKVVPLADPRLRFGMKTAAPTLHARIIVLDLHINGEPAIVAIRADKVYEVTRLEAASLQETPKIGLTWPPELIRCIGRRSDDFIVVMDIGRLFALSSMNTPAGSPDQDQQAA